MSVLRSLLFYVLFYGGSLIFVSSAIAAVLFGRHAVRAVCDGWSGWHRWLVTAVLGMRVVIEGERAKGAALYALKHESFFEAIDLPTLLDYPAPFAKAELFALPGWGVAARRYGAVAVAREEGARALRAMVAEGRALAETGRPLCIFPEGTRVPHGEKPSLRSGFSGLYKLLGLPVVPVAVNSGPLYHRAWKQPGTITIRFGNAIPPGLPRAEVEAQVHRAINALND